MSLALSTLRAMEKRCLRPPTARSATPRKGLRASPSMASFASLQTMRARLHGILSGSMAEGLVGGAEEEEEAEQEEEMEKEVRLAWLIGLEED